ncbi:MAG: DUF5050 domain-containing protein [Saccharofermentanales bacterium]
MKPCRSMFIVLVVLSTMLAGCVKTGNDSFLSESSDDLSTASSRSSEDAGSINEPSGSNPSVILDEPAGNAINQGIAAYYEGWIYYRNSDDDFKIYKVGEDGSNPVKFMDDSGIWLTLADGWIYYRNGSDGQKLYKIRLDGSERTKISDEKMMYLNIVGDWIYYRNSGDKNRLYKIKTDGSGKIAVNDEYSDKITASGDWIYYITYADADSMVLPEDSLLIKIRHDGTDRTVILDGFCLSYSVSGDRIYYLEPSDMTDEKGRICSMLADGSDKTVISEDLADNLNVAGSWIFYSVAEFDGDGNPLEISHLYRIGIDGSSRIELAEGKLISNINIAGDWLYYEDFLDGNAIFRVRVDRSVG